MKCIKLTIIFCTLAINGLCIAQDSFRGLIIDSRSNTKTIVVEKAFEASTRAVDLKEGLSGVSINAKIELETYSSYVRIILELPDEDEEFLIYEAFYPKDPINSVFYANDIALETSLLKASTSKSSLKIEINKATCELIDYTVSENTTAIKIASLSKDISNQTINSINKQIEKDGLLWLAGETEISALSYKEKKYILGRNEKGEMNNFQGFEYYVDGIFELKSDEPQTEFSPILKSSEVTYVSQFDWRNRHGATTLGSPYYNPPFGWVTTVKDQLGCNSCAIFAVIGTVESLANLYFNRPLNLDLSEQKLVSCFTTGNCEAGNGWNPGNTILHLRTNGVPEDSCFPYTATDRPCNEQCANPSDNIRVSGKIDCGTPYFPRTENNIKQNLIKYGPISSGIYSWGHAMPLIGYKTIQAGDKLYTSGYTTVTIPAGDSRIGQTAWLFKNSWASSWGNQGFAYILLDKISDIGWTHVILTPIISSNYTSADVVCEDRDGDGYYFWGIGDKPAICPDCTPDEPDGDDSNPNLGAMDEYGNIEIITSPYIQPETIINSSQTWSDTRTLCGDLIIQSNSTLTLTGSLSIPLDSKIEVRNGGTLTVNAGTIKNANIIVKAGGKLEIKMNGILEYASGDELIVETGGILDFGYGETKH